MTLRQLFFTFLNQERLVFKFQGLAQKLTGVVLAKIMPDLIA